MSEWPAAVPTSVEVDWTDAGDFSGTYDDISAYIKRGIKVNRGRDQGRVIGAPKVAFSSWAASNESRIFASEYSGSPLHGLLFPGHLARIGRYLGDDTITMDDAGVEMDDARALMDGYVKIMIFHGHIEEPRESYGIGRRTVDFSAYGLTQDLLEETISIPYQATITTGALVVLALQAAGVSSDMYVVDQDAIDNGRELEHYFAEGVSAWSVIRTAWACEGPPSAWYEDADGRGHFEGRSYRALADRWQNVQAIYLDKPSATNDLYHVDVQSDASHSSVINDMQIVVDQRVVQSLQQVWQYTGILTLGASETRSIFATNTSGDPWTGTVAPASPTDFTVTAGALVSVSIEQLGPMTVKITFVANTGGATVSPVGSNTGFALRAQPVTVLTTLTATGTIDTSDSQALYGRRQAQPDLLSSVWRSMSVTEANALIDTYLLAYPDPRQLVTVQLQSGNGDILYEIMRREVSDRVHVFDAWSGTDLDVAIEQIDHEITTGSDHRVTFITERIVETDWARFDVGRFDVDRFGN